MEGILFIATFATDTIQDTVKQANLGKLCSEARDELVLFSTAKLTHSWDIHVSP